VGSDFEDNDMLSFRRIPNIVFLLALGAPLLLFSCRSQDGIRFEISYGAEMSAEPLDGRLLVMISTDGAKEPRFQIVDGPDSQLAFGVDVEGFSAGEAVVIDSSVLGYPLRSLSEVPPGDYIIQALLHRYETFQRADGHVVKLPMDRGEGQQWNRAPGNLYSTPRKVRLEPDADQTVRIELDLEIPPIPEPPDTDYLKHIKLQSELLTEFWGHPMFLGAIVLLPEGFDEHPEARYPLVINHGHFSRTMADFREIPPDPDLEPEYSDRFDLEGYNRIVQEHGYQFFQDWTGPGFPRVILIEIQHANPYYDDSYAVNSENLGPYGDAITYELIPHIEEKFRGIGEGWARFLYGGSTGGWEALAAQVFYPDEYNGCFAACPDPIDFRAYTVVNIYEDSNAYFLDGTWKDVPRPGMRDYLGHISATLEGVNYRELVLGTKSRSGQQWDIWEAVYSPVGEDGYPRRLWDKRTGEIDSEVAAFWRENYDLRHILERDWSELGPRLEGKINVYCGDMDNYYLNNAVYLMEEFLESTTNPHYGGEVDYGDRAEHCWNGDHERPNAISRLRYHQMFIPRIADRILETAPAGADLRSWRY
jgi:hypothetical protein